MTLFINLKTGRAWARSEQNHDYDFVGGTAGSGGGGGSA